MDLDAIYQEFEETLRMNWIISKKATMPRL